MQTPTPRTKDPAAAPPLHEEADIGSGEKTPAQLETEKMIREIPPLPADMPAAGNKGKQDGARPS